MAKAAENPVLKGHVTAKCYDQSKLPFYKKFWNEIVEHFNLNKRKYYLLGPLKWKDDGGNVVCNVGFEALGQILIGTYGSTGEANYAALGTDNTVAVAADTTLGTETYRNATFAGAVSGNITYMTAFYTKTEVSGTFEEFGLFIDGTGTIDTGVMLNHYITGGWVKTAVDALVVDIKFTWTS